ncbi:sigma-70 family RNA polymerase sigma factor [Flavobacterium ovatum]|uniref:sigma-70 family RNA polymerase sigma factor n=1 Tax=Flavobacterium ovatum TaxID=1928857 RepID=UPI00344D9CC4
MHNTIHVQLESLFLVHYKDWCFLSYSYLKDKEEAEEIVQDVCAKILLKKKEEEILNLKAYIIVAIKNSCLKKIKFQQKFSSLSETELVNDFETIDEQNQSLEQQTGKLLKVIEKLPQPAKNVFVRCVIDGEKYQEVADTLGISVNTVKYHIKSAYKKVRLEMVEYSLVTLLLLKFIRK